MGSNQINHVSKRSTPNAAVGSRTHSASGKSRAKSHGMAPSWADLVSKNRSAFGKNDGRRWAACEGCGSIWTKSDDDRDWHTEGDECTICDLRLDWLEDPWKVERRSIELCDGRAHKMTQTEETDTAAKSTQTVDFGSVRRVSS